MKWDDFRESENVEDRRGMSIPGGKGGLGLGTVVVLGVISYALGIDPRVLIGGAEMLSNGGGQQQQQQQGRAYHDSANDPLGKFAVKILGNTEDVWTALFPRQVGKPYVAPKMVVFSQATRSGCGMAQTAMGPFYCPLDQKVYIDLSFFQEMQQRFRAGGDFAYAYVIAHEVGHHVEKQMGWLDQAQARQQAVGGVEANRISVRIELMADCFAGVWAHHSNTQYRSLEPGDIEKAINAAQAIGDDTLQKQAQGYARQETFTHGSSAQRVRWLKQGLQTGDLKSCNTFQAKDL